MRTHLTGPKILGTVAHRLAFLHRRQERDGSLHLSNGASLGGARFELRLP